jgi:hypothetical protein
VIRERFCYPKYGSTPIETYGVIARWDPLDDAYTLWSNFMGPFIMHPLTARVLGVPENRLRFIVPADIGGSFGIKSSMYPYMALIALAAKLTGVPVKWIEDRHEHLLASSSGTDRVAYRELAAKKDGTVLGMRYRWLDNVGGYLRSPEPGCSFRPTGNFVGPYRFQHLEVDASVVMTNKSLTGPNRGYACGHLYFETERMMDLLAERVGPRSGRGQTEKSAPGEPDSVPLAIRRLLRQRRLSGGSRESAGDGELPGAAPAASDGASRRPILRHRRRAGSGSFRLEHGLRGDRARSAVPRQARVPAEVGSGGRRDDQGRPAGTRHRDPRHDTAGPGSSDRRFADRRRRARAHARRT